MSTVDRVNGSAEAGWPDLSGRGRLALAGLVGVGVANLIVIVWCDVLLRRAGRGDLATAPLTDAPYPVAAIAALVTGIVIVVRVRHPVGWLLLGIGIAITSLGASQAYAGYGAVARPGSLPAAAWVAPFMNVAIAPILGLVALVALLTPSGHLSNRSRWFAVAVVGGVAVWSLCQLLVPAEVDADPLPVLPNPWAIGALDGPISTVVWGAAALLVHVGVVVGCVSIVIRFRRSTGVERQQLRWVAYGAAVAGVLVIAIFVLAVLADDSLVFSILGATLVCILPITVTAAVSRFRLYELDRIISRSVLWLILIVAVAAVYTAVVVVLGWLGGGSSRVDAGIAAVAAALAVAPLRAVAQRWIDRALFGRRGEPFAVVSDLNRRLQTSATPENALQELVDTIAVDLRLPSVAVVSTDGSMLATCGVIDPGRVVRFALVRGHCDVGSLVVGLRRGEDGFSGSEQTLLEDIAGHAGAAVEAAVLVRDLRRSQRLLVTAREEERRRLRRDLHDGLGPQLTAVTLKVDAARNLLQVDAKHADELLAAIRTDVRTAIDDIRRVVYALRPPGLDELGLLGALRQHAHPVVPGAAGPEVTVVGDAVDGLPAPIEVAAYRIATEAITNTVRHARAHHCRVRVELNGDLTIEVQDDGVGMPADWTAGVGINSMRERAVELGGTLIVDSEPTTGTTVTAVLPGIVELRPAHSMDADP